MKTEAKSLARAVANVILKYFELSAGDGRAFALDTFGHTMCKRLREIARAIKSWEEAYLLMLIGFDAEPRRHTKTRNRQKAGSIPATRFLCFW
jgi:hypothetical protein